jgi:Flp pilus assembly protein TadD
VIGLTPDDVTAHERLGELLAAIGEFGQAKKVFRRILAMRPNDPIAQAKATASAVLHDRQRE